MPSSLPDPAPGYYEGEDGRIYEVRKARAGTWYAMLLRRDRHGGIEHKYVGHHVRLAERIEV